MSYSVYILKSLVRDFAKEFNFIKVIEYLHMSKNNMSISTLTTKFHTYRKIYYNILK